MTEQTTKAVIIRQPHTGTTKQGLRVVIGFSDQIEARVFGSVVKKANLMLDGDEHFRSGDVLLASVIDVQAELKARGFPAKDYEKGIASRRDELAEKEQQEREAAEKRAAEKAAKLRQATIEQRALELAEQERVKAEKRLWEKATKEVDGG